MQIKTEAGEHVAAAASADCEEEANLHGDGVVLEGEGVESTASIVPKEAKTDKKEKKPAARRKHWQPGARLVLGPSPALTNSQASYYLHADKSWCTQQMKSCASLRP